MSRFSKKLDTSCPQGSKLTTAAIKNDIINNNSAQEIKKVEKFVKKCQSADMTTAKVPKCQNTNIEDQDKDHEKAQKIENFYNSDKKWSNTEVPIRHMAEVPKCQNSSKLENVSSVDKILVESNSGNLAKQCQSAEMPQWPDAEVPKCQKLEDSKCEKCAEILPSTKYFKNKIIYNYCSCSNRISHASSIEETTILVKINGIQLHGLLDTGSDSTVITLNMIQDLFPGWQELPDVKHSSTNAILAGGQQIKILATKSICIQILNVHKWVDCHVIEGTGPLLLGINSLKTFNIKIVLESKGVEIYCCNKKIEKSTGQDNSFYLHNNNKLVFYPRQPTLVEFNDPGLVENKEYMVYSFRGPSLIIPTLTKANNGSILVYALNDSRKKAVIKKHEIFVKISGVDTTLKTDPLTTAIRSGTAVAHKFPHFNQYNRIFYQPSHTFSSRFNFMDTIFDKKQDSDFIKKEDST